MKKTNPLFMMFALVAAFALLATSCGDKCTYESDQDCFCEENPNDPRCLVVDCTYEEDPNCFCTNNPNDPRCSVSSNLPDSIKNGSNFYVIFMDAVSELGLGDKVIVPTMMRNYQVWPAGESLLGTDRVGINAWGEPEAWVSMDVANWADIWNGGGLEVVYSEYEVMPDLTPLMDGGYYLHFAIKSPNNQTNAGWTLFIYSDGEDQTYFYGPQENCPDGQIYGGNYAHDGEWHHFEISVDEMMGNSYIWKWAINENPDFATVDDPATPDYNEGNRLILGFQASPHIPGTELNLDAIFYYKKP
jgi:hypothetical protein